MLPRMARIFISHATANNADALALAEWLTAEGWDDFFLDISLEEGITAGERWQEAIRAAANRCEVVLCLLSEAWRASDWCRTEFLVAKQLGKLVIGVLIEDIAREALPREMLADRQLCDLASGQERVVFRVARDGLVPSTDVSFGAAGLQDLRQGLRKGGLDPASFTWPPAHDPGRSPYRGLKALEAVDAAVFFGRDAALVRALDQLHAMRDQGVERLFILIGASGSGKSSFLRAGLWPRVERDDLRYLPLDPIRPETAALSGSFGLAASLEKALRSRGMARSRAKVLEALSSAETFDRLLAELQGLAQSRSGADVAPTVLISIDQGEELFAPEGQGEAQALLELLASTLQLPSTHGDPAAARRRTMVLVAIRSDSYPRLQSAPQLQGVRPQLFDLPPMPPAEFKAVIEGPAARSTSAGLQLWIDPRLTERLLHDAQGPDALPLLAFTLERLYLDHGGDGDLKLAEYGEGVQAAIEAAVAEAFRDPGRDPEVPRDARQREELLRRAFVPWLAWIDPDTEERKRRPARWDEIPPEARPLLERLIGGRLLVRDLRAWSGQPQHQNTPVIEVAHEALLRQWPALTAWLDQDASDLKALHATNRAAKAWSEHHKDRTWAVHSGERLRAAEALLARSDFKKLLGEGGELYLDACRRKEDDQRRRERTQRIALRGLAAAVGLVVAVSGVILVGKLRDVAREVSLGLALAAKNQSDAGHPESALRIAFVASRSGPLSPSAPQAHAELARAAALSRLIASSHLHEDAVLQVRFSPDGRRVVTASRDGRAIVWDYVAGRSFSLRGHESEVRFAAFSNDGKQILTASRDGTARLWDASSGHVQHIFPSRDGEISAAQLSSDGSRVLTASRDRAWLWSAADEKKLRTFETADAITSVRLSPDEERVVAGCVDGAVRVWDARAGTPVARLAGHQGSVLSVDFSPDSTRVLTASTDGSARVWDTETGTQLLPALMHRSEVVSAVFRADGRLILTASADGTARVWDAASGQELSRLVHGAAVASAEFSVDGLRIVTASADHTARVWDAEAGTQTAVFQGSGEEATFASFDRSAQRVVVASVDGSVRIWDATPLGEKARLDGHAEAVRSAVFSRDDLRVLSVSEDRTARVWDVESGAPLPGATEQAVALAALASDGRRIAVARIDGGIAIRDLQSGETVPMQDAADEMRALALSPDGRWLAAAPHRGAPELWDAATGQVRAVLESQEGRVSDVAFDADGTRVLTASSDGTARIWEAETGAPILTLQHPQAVLAAAFSPTGSRVVTRSSDDAAHLWDSRRGVQIAKLEHAQELTAVRFSLDGTRVLTASRDGTARIWDAETGSPVATLQGHTAAVLAAAFSHDGRRIVTASADHTARIWDATTGTALAELIGHGGEVLSAEFSSQGRIVLTASSDHTARLWNVAWLTLPLEPLVQKICTEKIVESRRISALDLGVAPALEDRIGRDVCEL